MNNNFFELFKELDSLLNYESRENDNDNFLYRFKNLIRKDKRLLYFEHELIILNRIRNIQAHNSNIDKYFIATKYSCDTLNEIIQIIKMPKKALSISVKDRNIYKRKIHDSIKETMKVMNEKVYTHVPIVNDSNMIIGVFSENVLFNYYNSNEITMIDDDTTFEELKDYIPIEKHVNEEFLFIDENALLSDVEKLFSDAFKNIKRLAVIYITHSGKQTESILGMITPWDILS